MLLSKLFTPDILKSLLLCTKAAFRCCFFFSFLCTPRNDFLFFSLFRKLTQLIVSISFISHMFRESSSPLGVTVRYVGWWFKNRVSIVGWIRWFPSSMQDDSVACEPRCSLYPRSWSGSSVWQLYDYPDSLPPYRAFFLSSPLISQPLYAAFFFVVVFFF